MLLAALLLSACGGSEPQTSKTTAPPKDASQPQKLDPLLQYQVDSWFVDGAEGETILDKCVGMWYLEGSTNDDATEYASAVESDVNSWLEFYEDGSCFFCSGDTIVRLMWDVVADVLCTDDGLMLAYVPQQGKEVLGITGTEIVDTSEDITLWYVRTPVLEAQKQADTQALEGIWCSHTMILSESQYEYYEDEGDYCEFLADGTFVDRQSGQDTVSYWITQGGVVFLPDTLEVLKLDEEGNLCITDGNWSVLYSRDRRAEEVVVKPLTESDPPYQPLQGEWYLVGADLPEGYMELPKSNFQKMTFDEYWFLETNSNGSVKTYMLDYRNGHVSVDDSVYFTVEDETLVQHGKNSTMYFSRTPNQAYLDYAAKNPDA